MISFSIPRRTSIHSFLVPTPTPLELIQRTLNVVYSVLNQDKSIFSITFFGIRCENTVLTEFFPTPLAPFFSVFWCASHSVNFISTIFSECFVAVAVCCLHFALRYTLVQFKELHEMCYAVFLIVFFFVCFAYLFIWCLWCLVPNA